MKNILIVPSKTIDQRQKIRLQNQGIVIIEVEDPSKVRLLAPEFGIPQNDLVLSLLKALSVNGAIVCQDFVKDLYNRLRQNEEKNKS